MEPDRVLIVEDDHPLRELLMRGLRTEGFSPVAAVDGASAMAFCEAESIAAVVMDIGLPDADGRDVCIALRARGVHAPVLFLTARAGIGDRLSGFSAGGDDYLVKPFWVAEVVARLRVLLRRPGGASVQTASGMLLDPATHSLQLGDQLISLTPTEFRLLAALLAASGSVVRRRALVSAGWPDGAAVSDNTVDQYISRIRRKVGDIGSGRAVESVKGVGFRIA